MFFIYKTYYVEYDYSSLNKPKTLLLLHGWGGNKNSFIQLKKILASQFNVFSFSLPPYGHSIIPLNMYDYMHIVTNILRLYNINKVSIVCHSFGMRVSLMLATQLDVEKIVITGGAGIIFKPNFFKRLTSKFNLIFLNRNPEYFTQIASSDYTHLSPIDKITFKNIVNKNLVNYIPLLRCPAMLFWGTHDTATPIKMLKKFKKLHHNTNCVIIKNGSHFCYLDYPYKFIECCENFLNQ